MMRARRLAGALLALAISAAPLGAAAPQAAQAPEGGLGEWLEAVAVTLEGAAADAEAGRVDAARSAVTRVYLDHFERIEGFYGQGGPHAAEPLATRIADAERRFHTLLRGGTGADAFARVAAELAGEMGAIRAAAAEAGVPFRPEAPVVAATPGADVDPARARTTEVRAILEELSAAERAYGAGDAAAALAGVEHAYLEGIELLEARIPSARVGRIERLIHLTLRPQITRGAPADAVSASFGALYAELLEADTALDEGGSFWFGAVNAFVIILREGLEAVLLIGALLAYLGATGAGPRHRRQIYTGVGIGVAASFATWIAARTIIPIGGANRELVEGVTALVAVAVLLYVAHWLFQKTYIHDWKEYLRSHLGEAVSSGSSLAMAGLAFAAVYREGFETVLFYQALMFDAGAGAVLAGFVPGMILILGVGVAIIRLGLRLPLRQVFAATNTILLYLAFVFLGKGIYNLQEAGLFAPHPLAWAPDSQALRLGLGFYPLAETVAAQALFLFLLGGTYLYYRVAVRRGAGAPA